MAKKYKKSLVWLRRDLRLYDHKALSEATRNSEAVYVAFVFDTEILKHLKNKKDLRVTFIYESLQEIDEQLRKNGSRLIVRTGDPISEIPQIINDVGAEALFYNEDYEPYAIRRDLKVQKKLAGQKLNFHKFKDQVIFSGNEVIKSNGEPYQVFTPYKKAWLNNLREKDYGIQKVGSSFANVQNTAMPTLKELGFERAKFHYDFQSPGRKNALKCLEKFEHHINGYDKNRDFPAIEGTSGISVHLRFGTISVRECLRHCLMNNSQGHKTWLSEIIWREFYQMILFNFPHVEKSSFKSKYSQLKWSGSAQNFKAWCDGRTGYPIVDAAMKQLNETGWMHNRLRMIVASFLTKDLLIDWRKGEAYFAEKLLDYDMAANNGGWQWTASTGCDAQPYFRVFNPRLQSERFDPNGDFLRKWIPELKNCSNKEIHEPDGVKNYPPPIVNHFNQKLLAIKMFKSFV